MQELLHQIAQISAAQCALLQQLRALDDSIAALALAIPTLKTIGSAVGLHCSVQTFHLLSEAVGSRTPGFSFQLTVRNNLPLRLGNQWSIIVVFVAQSSSLGPTGNFIGAAESIISVPLPILQPGESFSKTCQVQCPSSCCHGQLLVILTWHGHTAHPVVGVAQEHLGALLHSMHLDALHFVHPMVDGALWRAAGEGQRLSTSLMVCVPREVLAVHLAGDFFRRLIEPGAVPGTRLQHQRQAAQHNLQPLQGLHVAFSLLTEGEGQMEAPHAPLTLRGWLQIGRPGAETAAQVEMKVSPAALPSSMQHAHWLALYEIHLTAEHPSALRLLQTAVLRRVAYLQSTDWHGRQVLACTFMPCACHVF